MLFPPTVHVTRMGRALAFGILFSVAAGAVMADQITVFAAASLRNALDDIAATFETTTDHSVRLSYAGSSTLARQIERGAPADVFVSANIGWMDHLFAEGLIAPDTRFDMTHNRLVLIAHGAASPVTLDPGFDLAALLGDSRLAMALVDAVPAGIYGKAALTTLGMWETVSPRVAQTDNVRAALALVAHGQASYGIVYASDALVEPRVSVIANFPADTHPPITYPAAAITGQDNPAARAFLTYLRSDSAHEILIAQGFSLAPDYP